MQTCFRFQIAVSLILVITANPLLRGFADTPRCRFENIPVIGYLAGHFASPYKVCCPEVGCFETCGDFSHLPTPACAESYGINFKLYTQETQNAPATVGRATAIPAEFDSSVRTIFLIHGWQENRSTPWLPIVKDRLLEQGAANVIVVEWENGADEVWYPQSAANTRTTGAEIALIADRLKQERGVNPSLLWCVGFSLGGHTCGFAGKRTRFGRITGLDPAGPWFAIFKHTARLHHTDADFVDVIHTDGSPLSPGTLLEMGHVDFYPNKGQDQPGCSLDNYEGVYDSDETVLESVRLNVITCNHFRSTAYFLESLNNPECFKATHCECTDLDRLPESCVPCSYDSPQMGIHAVDWDNRIRRQSDKTMKVYLQTNSNAPYCSLPIAPVIPPLPPRQ